MRREAIGRKRFAKDTSDKGLLSKICEELNVNNKKTTQFKNGPAGAGVAQWVERLTVHQKVTV